MQDETWTLIKFVGQWIIYPLIGLIGIFYKKQVNEIQIIKEDVTKLKISEAIYKNQILELKEDIRDLTLAMKETSQDIKALIRELHK
jgi:hypothetical protein